MRRVAAALLVFALSRGAVPAAAQDVEAPADAADYEASLEPYGTWTDSGDHGEVWRPAVDAAWRPYVDGEWVWSPYGSTWVSYEPWAWTFHYYGAVGRRSATTSSRPPIGR